MRFRSLPVVDVVKKEDKEARLEAFICDQLSREAVSGVRHEKDRVMLLIARSGDSPVVRALASVVARGLAEGVSLKAVVTVPAAGMHVDWPRELAALTECRIVNDIRLLDGHEQLWLDGETVWIGDCMRREPSKRDAYECYAAGHAEMARFAEAAFDRFWQLARPAPTGTPLAPAEPVASIEPHIAGMTPSEMTPPTAATRH